MLKWLLKSGLASFMLFVWLLGISLGSKQAQQCMILLLLSLYCASHMFLWHPAIKWGKQLQSAKCKIISLRAMNQKEKHIVSSFIKLSILASKEDCFIRKWVQSFQISFVSSEICIRKFALEILPITELLFKLTLI